MCFVSVNGPREPYLLDEPRSSEEVIVLVCTGGACRRLQYMSSGISCVVDSADETMHLFSCGVPRSEAELKVAMVSQRKELFRDFGWDD
jgi:hypothetical protein